MKKWMDKCRQALSGSKRSSGDADAIKKRVTSQIGRAVTRLSER